ncbi:hypothetical protein KAFR_0K00770 [Kazachstania africana CBS 2517]|uniref:SWR1-complex protein 3 n=1 Tax=Kazachstania africana (strain ATCC 22294 / BCRC 22015 / CBS 2517 / CECT 1963 / NBRC 1671 / NRRL Y-8276) TaxID=1071382 RepID=H2B1D2_KAZAF|nr:hypothetical protein KAFR_0K00770 [Kazachstania africana CBS 2517]CCF60432.1 hypothetical protein KAFR_0K00770 [Kazachstania africana CBS 2517]
MPAVLRSRSKQPEASPQPAAQVRRRKRRTTEDEEDIDLLEDSDTATNNRPFEMIGDLPSSVSIPNYNSALTHPLSVKDSSVLYNSLRISRNTWIKGEMFESYWKRPLITGVNNNNVPTIKDKMQRMCECTLLGGPHEFKVRLHILKDDAIEQKWQEEEDSKKKAVKERRKMELEAKKKRIEERKQKQLLKKQEKEKQKEAKLKAKLEQQKMKEEIKKFKEQQKLLKKSNANVVKTEISKTNEIATKVKKNISEKKPMSNDSKLIQNLNLMAQKDVHVRNLMDLVATHNATPVQIETFRKIIDIAKSMPSDLKSPGPYIPIVSTRARQVLKKTETKKDEDTKASASPSSTALDTTGDKNDPLTMEKGNVTETNNSNTTTEEKTDEISKNKTEVEEENEQIEEKNDSIKESEEIEPSKSFKGSADGGKNDIISGKTNDPVKKEEESEIKVPKKVKKKIDDEDKLTGFQQKYVDESQLILEFLENNNARFYMPKDSIIEYDAENEKYVISWVLIHNRKEIEKFLRKHTKRDNKLTFNDILFYDDCPTPLINPMTVTILGIPKRFNQIVLNSVNPIEKVQAVMKRLLEISTRLSDYYLWYQLDGYDDAKLSEKLRIELNEYEQSLRPKKQKKIVI